MKTGPFARIKTPSSPARWRVVAAFAAVYIIWGSTYLGIRFAIETLPPLLMGGVRFLIAGTILYLFTRLRGAAAPAPARLHWRSAAIVGGLLLLGGNGGVMVAEQLVPSGLAAVVIATVPLWMVLLNWFRGDRVRPNAGMAVGLALGLLGIILLVGVGATGGVGRGNLYGVLILGVAALLWSIGSLYSRSAPLPADPLLSTAMEMLAGGGLLFLAGVLVGELGQVQWDQVSLRSVLALGYLILFGSLVAFSAYIWLLRVTTPARASTYAFVNPAVAVFLGWALAGEPLTGRILLATALIITAVVLITTYRVRPTGGPAQVESAGE